MAEIPEAKFARLGEDRIAYQVLGLLQWSSTVARDNTIVDQCLQLR